MVNAGSPAVDPNSPFVGGAFDDRLRRRHAGPAPVTYTVYERPGHDTSVAALPGNPGCAPPSGLGGTGTGLRTLTLRGRTLHPPYSSGDQ